MNNRPQERYSVKAVSQLPRAGLKERGGLDITLQRVISSVMHLTQLAKKQRNGSTNGLPRSIADVESIAAYIPRFQTLCGGSRRQDYRYQPGPRIFAICWQNGTGVRRQVNSRTHCLQLQAHLSHQRQRYLR